MKQRGKRVGGNAATEEWLHNVCGIVPNNSTWLRKKIDVIIAVFDDSDD